MAGTSELAVNTTGAAPAPAPAYDAETQAFIKRIDDYAAEMGGKGYTVNRQAIVGPEGADPYKALIAAGTDPRSLVDVGLAFKTNKGNAAKVRNNPTGTIYANPNYQYRITNEAGKNKVLYTGTGLEGLQNVYAIAQELSQKGGKKANWGVEELNPATGQWQRVADDDPAKNTLGKIAGIVLPALGAFAFPGLGILGGALGSAAGAASGSVASGVLQGKSLGNILKNAAITGGLSFAGGSLLGGTDKILVGANKSLVNPSSILDAASTGATGSALGSAASDIVVPGLRNVIPGAFGGAAGAATGAAASGALSGSSGSTPQSAEEILVEANKPLVNPSGILDAATLASLGIPASISGGKPMKLSDVANYLKLASLGVGLVGNMFTGSGNGNQGTMPGPLGTTAPVFGASLPTTTTVFGSNGAPTPRRIGPYDWKTYGQRPELSFYSNVPQRFAEGGLADKLSIRPSQRGDGAKGGQDPFGFPVEGPAGALKREVVYDGAVDEDDLTPAEVRARRRYQRDQYELAVEREADRKRAEARQALSDRLNHDIGAHAAESELFKRNIHRKSRGGLAVKHRNGPVAAVARKAHGGLAVEGPGTGRSDSIPAELSDGEYVVDAETVALLGDGSSKAGAKALDDMRVSVRKHKGRKLAKGEFSVKAKQPEHYIAKGKR